MNIRNMVEINNLTSYEINETEVKTIILEVFRLEKAKKEEISVAFVDRNKIKEINREYRNIDAPTDVLTFVEEKEIIICPDEIDDLKRVLIHGTLHLLGYDHEKDQGEMIKKQEKYFSLI